MPTLEAFYETVQNALVATLATAANDSVTMRAISPVCCGDAILLFTGSDSTKYRQMRANPHCCIAIGAYFAEATVEFRGATMLPENAALRAVYSGKFPGAFDEGVEFCGRNAEFLLLHPKHISGWAFANETPAENEIPTVPFSITVP